MLSEDKINFLKKIPKIQLEQMGHGNLIEMLDHDEDFLSKSSISDSDFQLLMKDNFFELVKDIQTDLKKVEIQTKTPLQMPKYDSKIAYDSEFYNLFIKNQSLMESVEEEANEINEIQMQIYRISDFYD